MVSRVSAVTTAMSLVLMTVTVAGSGQVELGLAIVHSGCNVREDA